MSLIDLYSRNLSGMSPAPYRPTGFGEVLASNLYAYSLQQDLGFTKLVFQADEASAFSERNDLIRERFQVEDPFSLIDTSDIDAKYPNPTPQGRVRALNEKQARLDAFINEQRAREPEKWQDVKTKKEIEAPLRREAISSAAIAGDITSRAPAFAAFAGTLLGGFGGAMTDVVNLATLPIGAGTSMGVVRTMAAEGALNAAIEASQVEGRAEWMNELGMKYGLKEAAMDIAFAGAGAAAIVGVARGGGALYRSLSQRGSKGVEVLSDLSDNKSLPVEVRDAIKYQSRVAHIDEENPIVNPSFEDVAAHRVNLDETQKAIREYREPVYSEEGRGLSEENLRLVETKRVLDDAATEANVIKQAEPDTDPILTPETNPMETTRTSTEAMDEAIPAFEADFARLLKENPDMEIDMDGVKKRMFDVEDEIKQNNAILDAIRTCAIG
jgi:hypothetical protein